MVPWQAVVPGDTDRATFLGQTGSGKTFLAEQLVRTRGFVVVHDGKGRINWPGFELHRSLETLVKAKEPKLIYRPHYEEFQEWDTANNFFEWVFRRQHTTLYIDELLMVNPDMKGDVYPYYFGSCFTQGRELGVEVWTATQRPSRIPGIVLSEAEHLYVFKLRLARDREKAEEMTGIPGAEVLALPKWQFYYAPQEGEPLGPLMASAPRRSQAA